MNFVINDLNAQLLSRAILEPGEQLTAKVMGKQEPWYTKFLKFDFLMPYILFMATDRRLLMLVHEKKLFGGGYELVSVEWSPWSEVQELAAKGLITKDKLRFSGVTQRGHRRLTTKIPMFRPPLRNNGKELTAMVRAFQSGRSLPPGSVAPMLQPASVPPSGYGQSAQAPAFAPGYGPPTSRA